MLIKKPPRQFPDLCTYRSQSKYTQLAIMQYLKACIKNDSQININTISGAQSYKFAKIISININRSPFDLVVETLSGESIDLPIELIVSVDLID